MARSSKPKLGPSEKILLQRLKARVNGIKNRRRLSKYLSEIAHTTVTVTTIAGSDVHVRFCEPEIDPMSAVLIMNAMGTGATTLGVEHYNNYDDWDGYHDCYGYLQIILRGVRLWPEGILHE